jgi:tetratricopeptide (TPR) repeat protein
VVLPLGAQSGPGYSGAEACAKCHPTVHRDWAESRHGKMIQPATEQSVKGDFTQAKLILRGSSFLLEHRGTSYYITESDLTGRPWEHRVEYTLGDRRIQHYLTTLPDGSIILLRPVWDIRAGKWSHEQDIGNPEETPGEGAQVWNKTCFSCHVSGGRKNFDQQALRYRTTWRSLGIDCESCHGPGSEHVARARGATAGNPAARAAIRSAIVNPARLDASRSSMVCAQCHSFRDEYAEGFPAGGNYYDYFLPVMEYRLPESDDPAFWSDGRTRRFANNAVGLWQSECFLKGGATCLTCHSHPHANLERSPKLHPDGNAPCMRCHAVIAANVATHTHHAANSPGSSCVECHMPATVFGLNTRMRDHSMSIPVPENTSRHGIPNACNLCHKEKDAAWALRQMTAWQGNQSRQKLMRRADAFAQARKGDVTAVPALLQILTDPSGGPWIRANAAGYLGTFPNDPSAYDALLHAFSDTEPLVRLTAATSIRPRAAQRAALAPALVALLGDSTQTVQISAAIALVAMGARQLPPEASERFERAKQLYRARADLGSDDAAQQFAAGRFFLLAGDADGAASAFREAIRLDPAVPAQFLLAEALAVKGDFPAARQILEAIPRSDPQYASAQKLLAEVEARERGQGAALPDRSAPAPGNTDADGQFLEGQVLFRNLYYGAALKAFEQALDRAPHAEWALKAQIYRAICLEKLSRMAEAEPAIQALSQDPAARQDVDLQLAYAELLYETSRNEEALKRIDGLVAAAPGAPMAHFWRAKILLALQRTDEAARAAEESIRLLPDLPQAHNLLMRIYLLQGRTKEAQQQAEWLRDYERRTQ